jgi:hypothetical protein
MPHSESTGEQWSLALNLALSLAQLGCLREYVAPKMAAT